MSGTCGLHHSSIMSKNSITNAVEGSIEVRNVMLQLPPFISRATLPARMLSKDQTSVWSIIKNAIGKDLTRLTVPINFNEPISLIQRLAENMENSYLITKALECKDQCERLELVGAFAASTMSNLRISKPFKYANKEQVIEGQIAVVELSMRRPGRRNAFQKPDKKLMEEISDDEGDLEDSSIERKIYLDATGNCVYCFAHSAPPHNLVKQCPYTVCKCAQCFGLDLAKSKNS